MRRTRPGHVSWVWLRRHVSVLLLAGFGLVALAGFAAAYWTIAVNSGPQGSAAASSLSAPTGASASEGNNTVTISWSTGAEPSGTTYSVTRTPSGGGATTVCSGISGSNCTDINFSPGIMYTYAVTAVLDNWHSSTDAASPITTLGVTTSSLPNGTVDSAYSTTLTATGGSGTYSSWARTSGTLPAWSSLTSSTGTISGTPTAAATTSGLVFTVTDSAGNTASSASLSLTVNAASTTTSLSVTPSSVTYGNESSVVFTATVSPSSPTAPTGTIAIKSGSNSLCTITLPATTCSPPNTNAGNTTLAGSSTPYGVTATYTPGNGNFSGSTSGSQNLSINKAATTTAVSFTSSSTYGAETSESFSVTVTGVSGGVAPTGTASVYDGSNLLCTTGSLTASSDAGSGSCSLTATQLSAGTYSTANSDAIVTTYNPASDPNYLTSSSSGQTLTVNQDATTTTVSASSSSVTYGNEAASTFTVTVATSHGEQLDQNATVTVNVGSASCPATVTPSGSGGSGTCEIAETALPANTTAYTTSATYSGDTDLMSSTGTRGLPTTTIYATSSASTADSAAICPAGDVALGGGGYDSDTSDPHEGEIAPTVDPTLTTALSTSGSTTSLKVPALLSAVSSGDTIVTVDGTHIQTWTASGAAAIGATSISVVSQTANFAYPITVTAVEDQTNNVQSVPPVSSSGTPPGQPSLGFYATNDDSVAETAYAVCTGSSLSTVTEYATSASGTGESETVSCPVGDVAVGGGGFDSATTDHLGDLQPTYSGLVPPTTGTSGTLEELANAPTEWYAANKSDTATETAYVICTGSSLNTVAYYETSSSSTGASETVSCPAGDVALGGGGYDNLSTDPHEDDLQPTYPGLTVPTTGSGSFSTAPNGWVAANKSDSAATETAYVVCTSAGFTVNDDSTTGHLTESASSATYGAENGVTFTASVTTGNGEKLPSTDSETINVGTTSCAASVAPAAGGGSGSCTIGATALGASSTAYPVTFTYGGDTDESAASQASVSGGFIVNKDSTTGHVTESAPSATYGVENGVTFTASVTTTNGEELPSTDSETITVGTTSCTASVAPAAGGGSGSCEIAAAALPVNSSAYSVIYTYGGDTDESAASQANVSGGFSVTTQDSTTTTVSESPTTVIYGDEEASVIAVTVKTGHNEELPATENETVTVGSTTCTAAVAPATNGGSGSCEVPATALPVSSSAYSISATYSGDTDLTGSSGSATTGLTVGKDTTTTAISESPTSVTYGDEEASVFTMTVTTGHHEVLPATENETVTIGSTTCTASVAPSGNGGSGTCSIGATALPYSSTAYAVGATYTADTDLTTSSGSASTGLTVNKDTASVSLTVNSSSSATSTYGAESNLTFSATVTATNGEIIPNSDTVTVIEASNSVCTITLTNGSGQCTSPNTAIPGGSAETVTGTFNSTGADANFVSTDSHSVTVTVTKDSTTTTVSESPTTVTYGDEEASVITVTVTTGQPRSVTGHRERDGHRRHEPLDHLHRLCRSWWQRRLGHLFHRRYGPARQRQRLRRFCHLHGRHRPEHFLGLCHHRPHGHQGLDHHHRL